MMLPHLNCHHQYESVIGEVYQIREHANCEPSLRVEASLWDEIPLDCSICIRQEVARHESEMSVERLLIVLHLIVLLED